MPIPPSATLDNFTRILNLKGDWLLSVPAPEPPEIKNAVAVELKEVGEWDSTLIAYLCRIKHAAGNKKIEFRSAPENLQKLLDLSRNVTLAEKPPTLKQSRRYKAAVWFEKARDASIDALSFLGDIFIHLWQFSSGKKREHFRPKDWLEEFFQAGYKALPIVAFLSFLVGLILAFVSAIQLQMFGASIYVADLVGISMTREMGALMTAIIMAGRSGASYTAQIGSMKRSEELDALRTMGLSPIAMVVLPKVVSLTTMMPLLSVFSTFVGMFAGLLVANTVLDISVHQYIRETAQAVPLHDLFIGLIKAVVYGFLVAFAGAWRGMRCGNSADAVGKAATSAVVLALTLIVIANAVFAIMLNAMKL